MRFIVQLLRQMNKEYNKYFSAFNQMPSSLQQKEVSKLLFKLFILNNKHFWKSQLLTLELEFHTKINISFLSFLVLFKIRKI